MIGFSVLNIVKYAQIKIIALLVNKVLNIYNINKIEFLFLFNLLYK